MNKSQEIIEENLADQLQEQIKYEVNLVKKILNSNLFITYFISFIQVEKIIKFQKSKILTFIFTKEMLYKRFKSLYTN